MNEFYQNEDFSPDEEFYEEDDFYFMAIYCWYLSVDVYDPSDLNNRVSFINTIIETDTPFVDAHMFEEMLYEQVKKPFLDNIPLGDIAGVEQGIIFDVRTISFVGVKYEDLDDDDDDGEYVNPDPVRPGLLV